jgi:hypothetical protein
MIKLYTKYLLLFAGGLFLASLISSCKKDGKSVTVTPAAKPIATLGLYEAQSSIYRRVFIPISQIGTQKITYYSVFDTGSSGMTMDADSLIPKSMITTNGFVFTGDSVNVNGITITSKTGSVSYGDATGETTEYGNLAYAPITIGDANGNITTKRIPFFLYYKVMDVTNHKQLDPHSNDVFGVGPGTNFAGITIASPLSYFATSNGGTSGFKLSTFNKTGFTADGTYESGLLTIGLIPSDLSSTSGFVLHSLTNLGGGYGYSPDIPATVTYGGKTINATILFDTGTPAITNIEDSSAAANSTTLPDQSVVSITTTNGFTYKYTITSNTNSSYNLTQILKPSYTNDPRTIFSIDFFVNNEFLLDYSGHRIGLKNN